ncbi:hypothetical protein EIP91_008201 [Steccherinum ochraceum]|uniref:DUF6533 domain-containing protein n=1 Tax=Steccherinum ochraceum TaxID=92696 RepID=A0A4R0RNL9_9APHY|nr:hypothetical protein EIP91_008201 [Steccherinum ochraceum]
MSNQPPILSPQLVDLLVLAVRDAWLTRISAFVVVTIVTYDYFISFHLELELIWKKQWSIIKVVFLWHRYFGFLCVIFQCVGLISTDVTDKLYVVLTLHSLDFITYFVVYQLCVLGDRRDLSSLISYHIAGSVWFRWETWATPLLLFSSEVVVILWIWIIYGKSKRILTVMIPLFAAEVGGVLFILVKSLPDFDAGAHAIPGVTFCLITRATPLLKLLWVPILGFDSILLVLYLYKGFQAYRYPVPREHAGVLRAVYKHSLLNFLAIFGSYLACAVIWTAAEPGLSQIPVGFALSLSITNCTRLLLNIRRAYYVGTHGDVTVVFDPDTDSVTQSSTTPIVEWAAADPRGLSLEAGPGGRVELAEALLAGRDSPASRQSVEVKVSDEAQKDRWQYELRTMRARS